jgi:hypothetical protein
VRRRHEDIPLERSGSIQETVIPAFALGGALGSYIGFEVGVCRAATRAARATYRTQRALR